MRRVFFSGLLLWAALAPAGAAGANSTFEALPKRVRDNLWELQRACNLVGGRPGDPMQAVEAVDLDGDGYDEVLCTGKGPGTEDTPGRRYVLYVPRARQTYSLHVAPDDNAANMLRATWSPNALSGTAQPFRLALRQRAFSLPRPL